MIEVSQASRHHLVARYSVLGAGRRTGTQVVMRTSIRRRVFRTHTYSTASESDPKRPPADFVGTCSSRHPIISDGMNENTLRRHLRCLAPILLTPTLAGAGRKISMPRRRQYEAKKKTREPLNEVGPNGIPAQSWSFVLYTSREP